MVLEKGALTNSLFNYPKNMTFFSTSEKLEIDNIPFISNNPKPNRDEALEYYRRVTTSNQLHINLYENVVSVEKQSEHFITTTSKSTYISNNIIICTGFYFSASLKPNFLFFNLRGSSGRSLARAFSHQALTRLELK